MTCLNERMVGAALLLLSGSAFAGGAANDLPEAITVANIAPSMPVEVVPPVPEPQAYLFRYEMEYQASQPKAFFAQMDQFYSAQLGHTYTFVKKPAAGSDVGSTAAAAAPSAQFLDTGPSTAPQISIVQLPTSNTVLGAAPQRRLSLTVNDWVFSGTARVAVLHSHDSGATLTVRHGF